MNISDIKSEIEIELSKRDYYAMYKIIDNVSSEYLDCNMNTMEICVELIKQNQLLYEYMGSSKQYEMAFDLHNKIIKNRNRLFLSCFTKEQSELKELFKRAVGDFSIEY